MRRVSHGDLQKKRRSPTTLQTLLRRHVARSLSPSLRTAGSPLRVFPSGVKRRVPDRRTCLPYVRTRRRVTPRSWPARRLSIFEGSESELARSAAAEVLSHELKLEAPLQIDPTCRRPRHCIAGSSARIHSAPACSFPERQPLEICRRLVDLSRRSGREIFDQRRASADVARSQSGRIHVTYVVFRMEEGGDASLLFQPQK